MLPAHGHYLLEVSGRTDSQALASSVGKRREDVVRAKCRRIVARKLGTLEVLDQPEVDTGIFVALQEGQVGSRAPD